MVHSSETRDDTCAVTKPRDSAKSEKTISSRKAAGDSAGAPPNFFGRRGTSLRALLFGAKGEKAKATNSPGKSVGRRRDLSGSGFQNAKSDAWAELGRRFQVAHDPATSASSDDVVLARARSNAQDSKGALHASDSSRDVLPWAASWVAKRRGSHP